MTLGYRGRGVRVTDPAVVSELLDELDARGHRELDTCYVYGDGTCDQMLGDLGAADRFDLAIRFDPLATPRGHQPDVLLANVRASLARLRTSRVRVLYLNVRDVHTPIEATFGAVARLHDEGAFDELGLSNMSAADVNDFVSIAEQHSWVKPTVYQGLYNAISRAVEIELLPELRRNGIRFYAYNPLAGGAFAAAFGNDERVREGSRFDSGHQQGQEYRARYWNHHYLAAVTELRQACLIAGINPVDAVLRWLVHHSALNGDLADGIILGASSLDQLSQNLDAVSAGPLPPEVVTAIDQAAETTRPVWPPVSRTT
ncbi:hypothetical protein Ais01nite_77830 [Asanoa ishikariensis]|uniref:Aflatoxin B1 aldehyde reductase n=2 Tax=Asanoa ishikariensis TaxID=137265 RepID=A0A1H3KQQ7_9ACTN|nr:hypothetical protein Ais01nite_77830 [Asanoa ishikariensis]SDY54512.1 aflatoxin B1 aldehyde reductase [Asanoa ishikariensis]